MLLPVQTADLKMYFVVVFEGIGQFLAQGALGDMREVDLIVVLVAVEDVL
jgi:hypothetical protein